MVERRRSSLTLASTKTILDSVLNSSKAKQPSSSSIDRSPPFLRLEAGVLRFSRDETLEGKLSEGSFLVGAAASVLKWLSMVSGSTDWNYGSEMCTACSQDILKRFSSNIIYFKVTAMEPLNEPILRVSCGQTALVLGGNVASALPPDLFVNNSNDMMPSQADTVKTLASILASTLCPSSLSSKFRVSVFLYGPSGCGKRTVVKYVAHRLGLHIVEFICHDLISSSERKTSAALVNTFKAAQRILNQKDRVGPGEHGEKSIAGFLSVLDEKMSQKYTTEHLGKEDFSNALERSKKRNASALGTPKVPNLKWEDVGGLEEVKKSILDTVQGLFLARYKQLAGHDARE